MRAPPPARIKRFREHGAGDSYPMYDIAGIWGFPLVAPYQAVRCVKFMDVISNSASRKIPRTLLAQRES
jgi:hypothetical protein